MNGTPLQSRNFYEKSLGLLASSGVAKGERGAFRLWRHFYGGDTVGYAESYKTSKAVLK